MSHPSTAALFAVICDVCVKMAPVAHSAEVAMELALFNDWSEVDGVMLCPSCFFKSIKPADHQPLICIEVE